MINPIAAYEITIRVELENHPGTFAKFAAAVANAAGSLGGVEIISAGPSKIVRDVSVFVDDGTHAEKVIAAVSKVPSVQLVNVSDHLLQRHIGGKLRIEPRFELNNRSDLAEAYIPGSLSVGKEIVKHPLSVHDYTIKKNSVAVISDGSRVPDLGPAGPNAVIPLLEGKAMIYGHFGDVEAYPLALNAETTEELAKTIKSVEPAFGAIAIEAIDHEKHENLPEILDRTMHIPVIDDISDGWSIAIMAALYNIERGTGKKLSDTRILLHGPHPLLAPLLRLMEHAGADPEKCYVADHDQACLAHQIKNAEGRFPHDFPRHWQSASTLHAAHEVLLEMDVMIALAGRRPFGLEQLEKAHRKPLAAFFLGAAYDEVDPARLRDSARFVATTRPDMPNHIESTLSTPGLLKGALGVTATQINDEVRASASRALARVIHEAEIAGDHLLPVAFNMENAHLVSRAVAAAALKSGVAKRRRIRHAKYPTS